MSFSASRRTLGAALCCYQVRNLLLPRNNTSASFLLTVVAMSCAGAGKNFTAGLDLADHQDLLAPSSDAVGDPSRRALQLRKLLTSYQASFTALEEVSFVRWIAVGVVS